MAVSLISVDLDGTLLLPDKTISPRTVAAAKAAMAAGARFVINSGRMPESIRAAAEALHINAPVICFNGALTYDWDKQAECAAIDGCRPHTGADGPLPCLTRDTDAGRAVDGDLLDGTGVVAVEQRGGNSLQNVQGQERGCGDVGHVRCPSRASSAGQDSSAGEVAAGW